MMAIDFEKEARAWQLETGNSWCGLCDLDTDCSGCERIAKTSIAPKLRSVYNRALEDLCQALYEHLVIQDMRPACRVADALRIEDKGGSMTVTSSYTNEQVDEISKQRWKDGYHDGFLDGYEKAQEGAAEILQMAIIAAKRQYRRETDEVIRTQIDSQIETAELLQDLVRALRPDKGGA